MDSNIEKILQEVEMSSSVAELDSIYVKLFAKTGLLTSMMKNLANLSIEDKKIQGKIINDSKTLLQNAIQSKKEILIDQALDEKIAKEKIDLSLPINYIEKSGIHPISQVIEQIIAIFGSMGFKVATGNEIEDSWYNFTALNVPEHHPARQEHDTFYMSMLDKEKNKKLLRTHTSNVQIHSLMNAKEFPLKIIAPGRTYRSDSDSTHSPMFHQVEGLFVDLKENISVPLLKSMLLHFCSKFFGVENLPLRFRPSYFPFTSPSYEVDIQCNKSGSQLVIGEGNDWLEILGAGIVHPNVLNNCNVDTKTYSGLAFGIGIERLTMLKYGFKDMRALFESDKRWLSYNNFSVLKSPSITGGLD